MYSLFCKFLSLSFIDYPPYTSCVLFTRGCNWNCRYCYNKEICYSQDSLSFEDILTMLAKQSHLTEAVVVTGGEPTIHDDLPFYLMCFKDMGYKVKLDTNGSNPELLEECLKYVDFVSMDIKHVPEKYEFITGVKIDWQVLMKSVKLLKGFGSYELRCVWTPYHTWWDIVKLKRMFPELKVNPFVKYWKR